MAAHAANASDLTLDAGRPEPRQLEPDELESCRRCGFESCRCPSLEDVPYGEMPGEPGYVP